MLALIFKLLILIIIVFPQFQILTITFCGNQPFSFIVWDTVPISFGYHGRVTPECQSPESNLKRIHF